jgi:hypothetical protein
MSIPSLLAWAIGACLAAALVFSFWWPGPIVAVILAAAAILCGWLIGSRLIGIRDARREARRGRGGIPPGTGDP